MEALPGLGIARKSGDVLEKEMQLKFLKESFPGMKALALHEVLCEANFDVDRAAVTLKDMTKTNSKILPYKEWKNPSGNSTIYKRHLSSDSTNDTKRAKLENLFTEKKSAELTSNNESKPEVQQKSGISNMLLNYVPKHETISNKTDSQESTISDFKEASSNEKNLSKNEPKSHENWKQNSEPSETNLLKSKTKSGEISNQLKTSQLSETNLSKNQPRSEEMFNQLRNSGTSETFFSKNKPTPEENSKQLGISEASEINLSKNKSKPEENFKPLRIVRPSEAILSKHKPTSEANSKPLRSSEPSNINLSKNKLKPEENFKQLRIVRPSETILSKNKPTSEENSKQLRRSEPSNINLSKNKPKPEENFKQLKNTRPSEINLTNNKSKSEENSKQLRSIGTSEANLQKNRPTSEKKIKKLRRTESSELYLPKNKSKFEENSKQLSIGVSEVNLPKNKPSSEENLKKFRRIESTERNVSEHKSKSKKYSKQLRSSEPSEINLSNAKSKSEENFKQLKSSRPNEISLAKHKSKSGENSKQLRGIESIQSNIKDYFVEKTLEKMSQNKINITNEETSADSTSSSDSECSFLPEEAITSSSYYNSYEGNDLENDMNVLLNIFQTADISDLNFIASHSKRVVDAIVECRPYKSWMDLIQKLQNNKFLDIDVLNTARQLLDIYKNLKITISKLEEISNTIKKEIVLKEIKKQPSLVSPSVRLMEHQMLGLNWLVSMREMKINGILVDEDQFSTSVQVISFLAYLKEIKATKEGIPHLVVVPSWKKEDWQSDFRRISPGLKVFFYHGTKDERRQFRNEWYKGDISRYDVILAIQETFISTPEEMKMFRIMQFHCAVFDDTAALKNITNTNNENMIKIKAFQKLLLLSKPLETDILEMLSLLKFVFPTDFGQSSEDLVTFTNKNSAQRNNLSSFHLKIIEQGGKALKNVLFQRTKTETHETKVPSDYSLSTIINDQIESIFKEIQRLDLPIKLAFSQLTTSPRVCVKKLNLAVNTIRIKEKEECILAVRSSRRSRRCRGFNKWSKGKGQKSDSSALQSNSDTDSSNKFSRKNCFKSTDSDDSAGDVYNLYDSSPTVIRNVARRGRKPSGAVHIRQEVRVPTSTNVARRGRKFNGTSQISRVSLEEGVTKKRGRKRPQETSRDLQAPTTEHKTVQISSPTTKKNLEVKSIVIDQTISAENVGKESESDDDSYVDPNFEESKVSSPSSTDSNDSWKNTRGRNKIKLGNSKRNKKYTVTSTMDRMSESANILLQDMLSNSFKNIWKDGKDKSQDEHEEDSVKVNVNQMEIEYEADDITIKEEPLDRNIKVEVEDDITLHPHVLSSPGRDQMPASPQEDPLSIQEEERAEITERETQFSVVNIFNKDIILNVDDPTPTASSSVDLLADKSDNEPFRGFSCIDLTKNNNEIVVVSDDSEVEEQLNKKISFSEVLADIDEQLSTCIKTNNNCKIDNYRSEKNEDFDKVKTSNHFEIVDEHQRSSTETTREANVPVEFKNASPQPEHPDNSSESARREEFPLENTSYTDNVAESFKETNKYQRDDILNIILGGALSSSLDNDEEKVSKNDVSGGRQSLLSTLEIVRELPFSEKDNNFHSENEKSSQMSFSKPTLGTSGTDIGKGEG